MNNLKDFKLNVMSYKLPLPARSGSEHFKLRAGSQSTEGSPEDSNEKSDKKEMNKTEAKFFKNR